MFSASLPSQLQKLLLLPSILASLVTILSASVGVDTHYLRFNDNHQYWRHEVDEVGGLGMVGRNGNQFVVGGQPFYVNGFNTYWLMALAVDLSMRVKVTETFEDAETVGLTVARTWAFSDGGPGALQISPSIYDENVFKALDFVVSEAKKHNIRLILSLTNNWKDYGGKAQYVKWGRAAGLNLTSDDDFFTDPTVKGYYKNHIKTILNRINTISNTPYKEDPTIFAWELMNEPRCPTDPSGNTLQSWIEEMAMYVKSIDPKHLLEVGLEGFYGHSTPNRLQLNPNAFAGEVGTDFIRNHRAPAVDFATAHIYPDAWLSNSIPDEHLQFTNSWMKSHIDDAENALGMPVLFTEYGESAKDENFSVSFRDEFIDAVYKNILNSTRRGGGGGGCLLWQLFPRGTDYMDDGYAVVVTESKSTENVLSIQSRRLRMFNSRCSWRRSWSCRRN
ncbi:mannan endo-1,4-beta-mannosidase 8-like [Phalaenopsis equestris]|uniref:mannan endo-1,4-beta-mannosidase 8-like n=1 Tax=Phalaenopsis equestris TaxID=78828 RepID=UPI0009E32DF0|nr:mannan endo-1,4-beta-mannosidase 8-like [Phalaenopsis equestris]